MKISMIAAMSEMNSVIGADGDLPWSIPSEFEHFKRYTMGKIIVMGSDTFLSLPYPLQGRVHVVLTSDFKKIQNHIDSFKEKNPDVVIPTIFVMHSINEIMESIPSMDQFSPDFSTDEIIIIGGESIYEQFMDHADELVLTFVCGDIVGDRFFPEVDLSQWDKVSTTEITEMEGDDYPYYTVNFKRKTSAMIVDFVSKRVLDKGQTVLLQEASVSNEQAKVSNRLDGINARLFQIESLLVDVLGILKER
jgi:dihydrofolate reductase